MDLDGDGALNIKDYIGKNALKNRLQSSSTEIDKLYIKESLSMVYGL